VTNAATAPDTIRPDPRALDSAKLVTATVPATVAQIAGVVNELGRPPILMGHAFGGTLTQLLLVSPIRGQLSRQELRAPGATPWPHASALS
jgi:hypothetical protein